MRYCIAIGALLFEGNTLSPVVATIQDFRNKYFHSGADLVEKLRGGAVEMSGAIAALEEARAEIVPLFATHGGAGGRVAADAYRELKGLLLTPLKDAGDLDGVYLALHGAFVCEGVDDVEGDILADVREVVGDIPLVISCDLHAHITARMMTHADSIIGYRHYPHDDARDTGERCTQMLLQTLGGEIRPVTGVRKAPMLLPPLNSRTTGAGPMVEMHRWARAAEAEDDILAVSYFPVQPWLDLPEVGFAAVVVTDGDLQKADDLAVQLCQEAWQRRHEFLAELVEPQEAIHKGLAIEGQPIILSDTADCTGGGGSGDSAIVLKALLDSGVNAPAIILIVDPETVQESRLAGAGNRFRARIGNKVNPVYGAPVEAEVEVLRLFSGDFSYTGGIMAGPATMGPAALLRAGPVKVVVSTYSSYEYADEQFRAAGLEPRHYKFVVVKNPMNYLAAYAYAPAKMVLDTPGPTTCNLAAVPWRHITRPRFPVDIDFRPRFERLI
jgi:microcystin degradation protein MlrC